MDMLRQLQDLEKGSVVRIMDKTHPIPLVKRTRAIQKNAEDEATHSKEKPSSMKRLSFFFLIGAITLTEYYSVVEFR